MKSTIWALGIGLVLTWSSIGAAQGVLLVANKSESTLTFVDLATRQVLGTADTGLHPHEVVVTPDGRTAFVANYGAGDSLSVIDVAARRELRKIDLGQGRDPHGMQLSRDGNRLYVTAESVGAVLEIDVATEKVVRTLKTGQEVSHMLVLAPDGRRMYVANIRNGTVTVIDLERGEALAQINTGPGCEGIDITPDGRTVWTANKYAETVAVIDTKTDAVVARLPCPGRPIRVKITPDGKTALVLCAEQNMGLVFLDVATRRVIRIFHTGPAIGLTIDAAGQKVYLARTDVDLVMVLDLIRLDSLVEIRAGAAPDGLAIAVPR